VLGILFGLIQIAIFCGMVGMLIKTSSAHK
jgi:hypothetical protein